MAIGVFPKQTFYEIQRLNPYWSSWTCFCETIKGKKDITSRVIKRYFDKLVDKDDYSKTERGELIEYLLGLRVAEIKPPTALKKV